jgi:hypothetical protein
MLLVRKLGRMRRSITIVSILVFGLVGAFAINRVEATPAPPAIPGLTAQDMTWQGISVAGPSGAPTVTTTQALQSVPQLPAGSRVLQTVLADFTDSNLTPAVHCLCYLVSVTPTDPPTGPSGTPMQPGTYRIEVIDAMTGTWLGEVYN